MKIRRYSADKIFHCYIPYSDKELFVVALSKVDIDESIREDIIEYLDNDHYFDKGRYLGFFMRFFNEEWDFYEIEEEDHDKIEDISKKLEDPTYNTDGLTSRLPEGISTYIGKIKISDYDIELYNYMKKYNL